MQCIKKAVLSGHTSYHIFFLLFIFFVYFFSSGAGLDRNFPMQVITYTRRAIQPQLITTDLDFTAVDLVRLGSSATGKEFVCVKL